MSQLPTGLFFRQYYLDCLSQASYLVGDLVSGAAVVVDPQRDVSSYIDDAAEEGLHIVRVLETHFHADFVSGHLELAARTGASICFGAAATGRTEYAIETFTDGALLPLGDPATGVVLEIRETPGHTPESICIVIHPRGIASEPFGVLTGDTLFIGDVGRPDLLAAAGGSAAGLGKQLYKSLHERLLTLPDRTKVFPAHGAGSACGKNLSSETVSTIGEQRRSNYALQTASEREFVAAVAEGLPAAPPYFADAAAMNRRRHGLLDEVAELPRLSLAEVLRRQGDGAVVIDARDPSAFADGHLRRAVNVGLGGRFAEYAGCVIGPGTPIVLVAPPGRENEARVRLARVGLDDVLGVVDDVDEALSAHPQLADRLSRLSVERLAERMAASAPLVLLDVRNRGEVALGAIAGARHVSLAELRDRVSELDHRATTVVYCAGGYRSAIAASLLRSRGFADVADLVGGYAAWIDDPRPTVPLGDDACGPS